MHKTISTTRGLLALSLLALPFSLSCMSMQTELPGTLDLRQELAAPTDAPLEEKEPALGRSDQSFLQDFVLTESSAQPSQGQYQHPLPPEHRSPLAPKVRTTVYRRVIRQWYLLGIVPVAGDQGLFAADIKSDLSIPGSHLRKIRITSGQDIASHFFAMVPVIGAFLSLAPTRTTEIVAYIDQPVEAAAQTPGSGIMLVPAPEPVQATTTSPATAASPTDAHLAQPPVADPPKAASTPASEEDAQ